jgi:hypothetical protein
MTNYLVVAYRWGWTNNHQYIVYCGPDETKAIALADNEPEYRGGKYGACVYRFNEDGTDYEQIYYANSMYDEEKPHHNYRIDMFEKLGHRLHDFANGQVFVPDPKREGFLMLQKKRPPKWIKELVEHEEEFSQKMAEIMTAKKETEASK